MYHLTRLWLTLAFAVGIAGLTAGILIGVRIGRRRERRLWNRDYDIVRRRTP